MEPYARIAEAVGEELLGFWRRRPEAERLQRSDLRQQAVEVGDLGADRENPIQVLGVLRAEAEVPG